LKFWEISTEKEGGGKKVEFTLEKKKIPIFSKFLVKKWRNFARKKTIAQRQGKNT
jgi:hypothetical protein